MSQYLVFIHLNLISKIRINEKNQVTLSTAQVVVQEFIKVTYHDKYLSFFRPTSNVTDIFKRTLRPLLITNTFLNEEIILFENVMVFYNHNVLHI